MPRVPALDRRSILRRTWLAAPLGVLVLLGACESTDTNRPTSTKPGSTKRPATKARADWGVVSDADPAPGAPDRPTPMTAP
jgi:hypothetical protein